MTLDVLHVDNHLLGVRKPARTPIVPDESGDPSLFDDARDWIEREYDKPGRAFLGVVHRLDRPVSGVVLFARTSKAAARLTDAFRERRVDKLYFGVHARPPRESAGTLEQWLVKDRERNLVTVARAGDEGAKRAVSRWRVAAEVAGRVLVEWRPETGRAHQLRVAAATLGIPLLGDRKYGAPSGLEDRSIALHAARLALEHPVRREPLEITAPPPASPLWRFPGAPR